MAAKEIIRDALARALFDADPVLFAGFRHTVFDGQARPCDPGPVLAHRMIAELEHAGYYLARDRHHPKPDPIRARMLLEDHLVFGIEMTDRVFREALDAPDRAKAGAARTAMTERICETLTLMRVTLRKRRRTS